MGFPTKTPAKEPLENSAGSPEMDALLLGLVAIGAVLRLWQYFANTGLWLDEVLLASNILHRPTWELLRSPLDYTQVAPKGFLLLEKLASLALGPSDYVLRIVPVFCSLASLFAFWRVVRRLLQGLAAPIALALFATAGPLVIFGSEVKQYSVDVALAVFLLWLLARSRGK